MHQPAPYAKGFKCEETWSLSSRNCQNKAVQNDKDRHTLTSKKTTPAVITESLLENSEKTSKKSYPYQHAPHNKCQERNKLTVRKNDSWGI